MMKLVGRILAIGWIAHIVRAAMRYTNRLGTQFAGAMAYFSVLALIPILAVAFSIVAYVLKVRPALHANLVLAISQALGITDASGQAQVAAFIDTAISRSGTIGLIALVIAAYSAAGWMRNVRNALRAQWQDEFEKEKPEYNFVVMTLLDLVKLLGLIVLFTLTFALAALSTSLADTLVDLLGLDDIGWLTPVLNYVPIVFSIGAGWLLFMYLYSVLPRGKTPWPAVRRGSLLGALGLGALQLLAALGINLFTGNAAIAFFGPVIVLMLFLSLFGQLILFIGAWIATSEVPTRLSVADAEIAARMREATAARCGRGVPPPPEDLIPQAIAVRSVGVGMTAGYVTGAATGVGLGALIGWATSRLFRRG